MLGLGSKHKNKQKNKDFTEKSVSPNTARIGSSLLLKGELSGEEDLAIDGQFQGTIDLSNYTLTIDHKGRVEANIRAKNITIKGFVKGNIYASEKVFIHEKAQVQGDIVASKISVMDGAQFEGNAKIEKDMERIEVPKEKSDISFTKKTGSSDEEDIFIDE